MKKIDITTYLRENFEELVNSKWVEPRKETIERLVELCNKANVRNKGGIISIAYIHSGLIRK